MPAKKQKTEHPNRTPSPSPSQSSSTSSSGKDDWKHRAPYKVHNSPDHPFPTAWRGRCHCGTVQYRLSRRNPLSAKFCHCTTCQRLHGAPFQWAAIFHKEDIDFTSGVDNLVWYNSEKKCDGLGLGLPCKVACAECRSPIMDEGRNMILLFPALVAGVNDGDEDVGGGMDGEVRHAMKPSCHMFYGSRVVDIRDGLDKWEGLDGKSRKMDEDGNVVEDKDDGEEDGK